MHQTELLPFRVTSIPLQTSELLITIYHPLRSVSTISVALGSSDVPVRYIYIPSSERTPVFPPPPTPTPYQSERPRKPPPAPCPAPPILPRPDASQEQNKPKTNEEQNCNEGEKEKEREVEREEEEEKEREKECEYTPYIPPLPAEETNAEQDDGFDAFCRIPLNSLILRSAAFYLFNMCFYQKAAKCDCAASSWLSRAFQW